MEETARPISIIFNRSLQFLQILPCFSQLHSRLQQISPLIHQHRLVLFDGMPFCPHEVVNKLSRLLKLEVRLLVIMPGLPGLEVSVAGRVMAGLVHCFLHIFGAICLQE